MNAIFISLRCISAIKLVIALLRGLIKARKFSKFKNKADTYTQCDPKYIGNSREELDNKCIICLEDLSRNDSNNNDSVDDTNTDKKYLVLSCKHIFHLECFEQWYIASGNCPYCRKMVEI
jgi:hypothetical protein